MIPCTTTEIHRWNALDDLDDDISDRVNDDLIPYDDVDDDVDDVDDLRQYEDPSLLLIDSDVTTDSSVDETNKTNDVSSDFSSHIDEDGLILALEDSTNRILRSRHQGMASKSRSINSTSNDIVTVRVKKSVKYGNQENSTKRNIRMTAANKKEIIRPLVFSSDRGGIVPPDIYTMYSDGTMNSLTPTEEELNQRKDNVMTVRVKKSVKYGKKENTLTEYKSRDIVQRPKINTIHSDGTISSVSISVDESSSSIIRHSQTEDIKPRVATIRSDGTIGYSDESNSAIVEKPVQRIATINGDGTISYREGNEIGDNETALVIHKPPSKIATIHSNGLISYSSAEANHSPTTQIATMRKSVSFDNVVTDTEENDAGENGGDDADFDEDMDDDICDKLDDSRYTRSLHSMPVLEEVTEEESPVHSESTLFKDQAQTLREEQPSWIDFEDQVEEQPSWIDFEEQEISLTPKETPKEKEPTWIELKQSPSATTFMTPRRSNDDGSYGEEVSTTSDNLTSSWLGLKGLAKFKNGAKYQSMENSTSASSNFTGKTFAQECKKGSWKNTMLRVETCSTSSQTERTDSPKDVESGGTGSTKRALRGKRPSYRGGYQLSDSDQDPPQNKTQVSCCFRRREWIVAFVLVLIGVTVGVASFFIMHTFFIDDVEDREKERTEEWTMVEAGSPFGTIASGEPLLSSAPSEAPIKPIDNGKFLAIQDTVVMNEVIRRARREIEVLIFDDDDLIGKVRTILSFKTPKFADMVSQHFLSFARSLYIPVSSACFP